MRTWGGARLFVRASLIGLSTGLVVDIGITELVILILLFCGILQMTRSLEEERTAEADREVGWSGKEGRIEEKKSSRLKEKWTEHGLTAEGGICIGCRGLAQPLERAVVRQEERQIRGAVTEERRGRKFYAVLRGRQPGIYTGWGDCKLQVEGFSGARFKGFVFLHDAEEFMRLTKE